jgi:hypothetical protein
MTTKKESKADAKATANEEETEQAFLAEQAKKPKAEQQSAEALQPREGDEEFLPPPDPPKVKSEPTEVVEPLAVDESEKGAHPEDPAAEFELDLIPDSVYPRGDGPVPTPTEAEPKSKEEEK